MMSQALQQVRPERGRARMGPASGGTVPMNPGFTAVGAWRARNWRRVLLAWFALSVIIMMVAAEPHSYFPKAQVRSVPAAQTFLRVAGGLTVAGVPVLLIALP